MNCPHHETERQRRDRTLGIVAIRRRVELQGSRFVFPKQWVNVRWSGLAGLRFGQVDALEFSAVTVPAPA